MEQQITQWIIDETKPCVRCGYCCKKSTCPLGMQFGSEPENCKFLKGEKPGEYYCQIVEEEWVDGAKTMVSIGDGCCSSLNSDRKIAESILGL